MDLNTMLKNIEDTKNAELEQAKQYYKTAPEDANETVEKVDIYQRDVNKRIDNSKKSFPKGSSVIVNTAVAEVVDERLAHAHREARDDSEVLRKKGERARADMRRQQYMEEYFLPAVEIVVNSASPDEVLNNKKALEELDKYASLRGSGKGYTASYIRQAYGNQLGQVEGHSDAYIASEMRKLNSLLDDGQLRSALGLARKLKEQIDDGSHIADENDYETLGRIVSFYS